MTIVLVTNADGAGFEHGVHHRGMRDDTLLEQGDVSRKRNKRDGLGERFASQACGGEKTTLYFINVAGP